MSQKQPTPIIDKNGKATTVHKNVETAPAFRLKGARPFVVATTPEEIKGKQISFISDLSNDLRVIIPASEFIGIKIDEDGDAYIASSSDINGDKVNLPSDANVWQDLDGVNRALRNIDYSLGRDEGYIVDIAPNKDNVVFAIDLNKADLAVQKFAVERILMEHYNDNPEDLVESITNNLNASYSDDDTYGRFHAVRSSIWNYNGEGTSLSSVDELFEKLGLEDEINYNAPR